MLSNRRTTDPDVEPITVQQLDAELRGDGQLASDDSVLMSALIRAAREYVEEFTRRALINQTHTLVMDAWPVRPHDNLGWWDGVREGAIPSLIHEGAVTLPIGPLQTIVQVRTFNEDNTATVFPSSNYFIDTNRVPGQLILNTGQTWPTFTRNRNGIEITYVAGYGTLATDIPAPLIAAVSALAVHWYENRETVKPGITEDPSLTPLHVQSILNRYKVQRL